MKHPVLWLEVRGKGSTGLWRFYGNIPAYSPESGQPDSRSRRTRTPPVSR